MRKTAIAFLAVIMLAASAFSNDDKRQRDLALLMIKRSQLQIQIAQETSLEAVGSLLEQLRKIEKKIYDMQIIIPSSLEPPLGKVDRTDLPVPRRPVFFDEGLPVDFYLAVSSYFSDNYFQAVFGTPRQSTWITNIASSFEVAFIRKERTQFSIAADIEHNVVRDIKNADWSVFGSRFIYAIRNHRFVLRGSYIPERLTFTAGDNMAGHSRTSSFGVDYSGRIKRKMRTRFFYRYSAARYPEFEDRNVQTSFVAGDAQYHFHNLFIPGIGLEWTNTRGKMNNYDYQELSPVLLLSARFGGVATLSLRYRHRVRNYPIDNSEAGNFGREDKRHDVYAYASIALGHYLDLVLFGSHLRNSSSRENRSFAALSTGAILQYRLPAR